MASAASDAVWRAVTADLQIGWPLGVVDGASATARLLLADRRPAVTLQRMTEVVAPAPWDDRAAAFDRYLLRQAIE